MNMSWTFETGLSNFFDDHFISMHEDIKMLWKIENDSYVEVARLWTQTFPQL